MASIADRPARLERRFSLRRVPEWFPASLALELAVATALALLLVAMGALRPNAIWSIPAAFIYLWYLLIFLRAEPQGTLMALPLIIISASAVVSLVMIEHGARVPELGMVGSAGSHTATFVLIEAVFFLSYVLIFRALHHKKPTELSSNTKRFFTRFRNTIGLTIIGGGVFSILALIALGLSAGFPLLEGIDRYVYRRALGTGLFVYILNFKSIIAFMLGFAAFSLDLSRPKRLLAIATFLGVIGISFLFGDKFFAILAAIATFALPWLYRNYALVLRRLPIFMAIGVIASLPAMAVTWMVYSNFGKLSNFAAMEKLGGRLVGQGQLWYIQTKVGAPAVAYDETLVDRNIEALTVKEINLFAVRKSIGPNYFSDRYAPPAIARSIHNNAGSITYTMALEPLALVTFGWVGVVFVKVFCGVLAAFLALYTVWAFRATSVLSAVFAIYLTVQFGAFLRQGAPWVFFSVYSLKWMTVILLVELALAALIASQSIRIGIARRRLRA